MKKLSDLNIRLLAEALIWSRNYVDSNPDVGMGPFDEDLLDDIAKRVGVHLTRDQTKLIINRAKETSPHTFR